MPHGANSNNSTPIALQVMYGGRAIDDFDRRVLRIYMDEYMGDFIFDTFQPFHFYHNAEVDYLIPPDGQRDNYLEAIDTLPLANTPEVFGLHANAEIGYFTMAAKEMWAQLVELQPQTGESGGGISREEFIGTIASDIQVRSSCLPPPPLTPLTLSLPHPPLPSPSPPLTLPSPHPPLTLTLPPLPLTLPPLPPPSPSTA